MAEKYRRFGVALVNELLCYLKSFDDENCARGVFQEQGKSANVQNCEAEEAADDQVADSARVYLAYWPVVSVVESDVFQLDMAGRTSKAIIMPGFSQSFDILVSCFYTHVTAFTKRCKHLVIVFNTVRLFILPMEYAVFKGLSAHGAHKAVHMPSLIESVHCIPNDLLAAFCTRVCNISLKTGTTIHKSSVFNKSRGLQ